MNKIIKVSLYFIQLITAAKIAFHRNVHACLTGNAAYLNPVVALATYATQIDAVEAKNTAVLAARTTLVMLEWELFKAEEVLDQTGRDLAGYVTGACNHDPAILESSGFSLAAPRQPVGTMPAPSNLRAESDLTGTVLLRWNRDRGSLSFNAEIATNPMGPWTSFYSGSRARGTATGLTSGTCYWLRVQVVGAAGWSNWSDSICKRPV
jgi:hypothetical protein